MWKSIVETRTSKSRFESPATGFEIEKAENILGAPLPDHLKECLLEANGIFGEYDLGLVWPLERIVSTNIEFRENSDFSELYMPFNSLLFFADAGNGDQFAYPIQAGIIRKYDVFVWNHENDSRNWVAPSLKNYIEWFLEGKIEV